MAWSLSEVHTAATGARSQTNERRAEFRGRDGTVTVIKKARRPEMFLRLPQSSKLELRLRQVELSSALRSRRRRRRPCLPPG